MSKSAAMWSIPNDVVAQYGADTMRMYIMFIGDFERPLLERQCGERAASGSSTVYGICMRAMWPRAETYSAKNESAIHKAIKKVSDDIEAMKFNTAIAALMALVNDFLCQRRQQG